MNDRSALLFPLCQFLAPGHEDLTGADQFEDAVGFEHLDHGVELFRAAGDLQYDGLFGDVQGLGLEVVTQLQDGGTGFFRSLHLDQGQFLVDDVLTGVVGGMEYVHQFGRLFDDLVQGFRIALGRDGDA